MAPMTDPKGSACPSPRLGAGFPERRTKRVKLQHDSSPEPSTVSDDSALVPTSVPEDTTDATDTDSGVSSVVSESSEEPSDESSEEDSDEDDAEVGNGVRGEVVNLRANRGEKPVMKLEKYEAEDIRPFLKDFLPKLKAANEELEAQRRAGTLETAEMEEEPDEEGQRQYIELNLGLGVLEVDSDGQNKNPTRAGDSNNSPPHDILGTLMGQVRPSAGVQVVEEKTEHTEYKDDSR